ncbi:retroviral-like aspartic protease family protein [Promineifilum sp.]|uniref:retroviral-like aspartic protease family protein n=1 Tax=Promineifilum sp. TaxID=2664178 RepID=UPI0035B338B4
MPVYSHPYDSQGHDPAMPVVGIGLLSIDTGDPLISLEAIVDSGADATMLPIEALRAAGARYYRAWRMRGVTGQSVNVDTYLTIIQLGPHVIYGVKAVAMSAGSEAILGRDVLNELELTLNGPAQELWVA